MEEPLELTFRNIDKSPDLESLAHDRVARFERFCDYITSCHVAVERPHGNEETGSGYRVRVEARVPPNHQLVADRESTQGDLHEDPAAVIRSACDAVERQLRELVERQREYDRGRPDRP